MLEISISPSEFCKCCLIRWGPKYWLWLSYFDSHFFIWASLFVFSLGQICLTVSRVVVLLILVILVGATQLQGPPHPPLSLLPPPQWTTLDHLSRPFEHLSIPRFWGLGVPLPDLWVLSVLSDLFPSMAYSPTLPLIQWPLLYLSNSLIYESGLDFPGCLQLPMEHLHLDESSEIKDVSAL